MTDSLNTVSQREQVRFVLFDAGQQRWSVQASQVREVHAVLTVQPVPQTAAWFLGTALPRGRLVAVSDFGVWLSAKDAVKAGPISAFIEFEQGFALGVESVQAGADSDSAKELDLQELLDSEAFCAVASSGERSSENYSQLARAQDAEYA